MTMKSVRFSTPCSGYRDRRTGQVFVSMPTQSETFDIVPIDMSFVNNSKLVQTPNFLLYPLVDEGVNTDKSQGTQMWRRDLYISSINDKILEPGDFDPGEKVQKIIVKVEEPKPIYLEYYKIEDVVIETIEDQEYAELKKWVNYYLNFNLMKEERIKMLLDLMFCLNNFEVVEVILPLEELILEEISMLEINAKHLDGLRNRIILFLNDLLDSKKPRHGKSKAPVLAMCPSCQEFKTSKSFKRSTSLNPKYCEECAMRVNKTLCETEVPGLGPYMDMIQEVKEEEDYPGNHIPQLIKPTEMKALLDEIWGGSIVSGETRGELLSLAKWDREEPWSPWNCIALTKHEAKTHQMQRDLTHFYSKEFIDAVTSKHRRAEKMFPHLQTKHHSNKKIKYMMGSILSSKFGEEIH